MTFPAYSEYKDSGVDWLGVVPEHWAVTLLKRGYEVVLGKMLQPEAKRDDDEFLPYLRAANIQLSGVDTVDVKRMWFGAEEKKSLLLRRGDLLVSEGGDVGRSAIWEFDEDECYFQNSINRIRSIDGNNTRFLYFWMIAIKKNGYVDVLCNKSTIAHFTAEKVAAVPLPIPTKSEQTQIARFLDHETARIDALIEEQQRLIELLKEKRQAVISHAVTKGLDPTVPLKDSGVEWLGEVPAHWTVAPVKLFFEFLDGQRIPLKAEDRGAMQGEYPYYGASGVIDFVNEYIFKDDLVLVSEDGANLLARSTPIAFVARGKYWVNNHAHILRPQDTNLAYWAEVIERQDLTIFVTGAAQPKLTAEALGAIKIAAPPTASERAEIEKFILDIDSKLGSLLKEAVSGVQLLQERRSALISAAVTGKIDVRGWQPPASAPTPELAQEAV
jgi:type I restriction enzyme S subunit